jgi:hypothetical protein
LKEKRALPIEPETAVNLSAPPRSRDTGHKSRHVADLSNIPLLGRTTWMSRIQQIATRAPRSSKHPQLLAFLKVWNWFGPYLRDLIHHNAPYQTYSDGETGIFPVAAPPGSGPMRISLVADWGTGTMESQLIAKHMLACDPHYTVHLGDVYYMGEACEIAENCLGKSTNDYKGVCWPKGRLGSFAVMGNHEMYSGGQGYFETFLPTLGLFDAERKVSNRQSASYFCLEAEHWVILGLDTGYHSGGVPAFTSIPVLNTFPFFNVDARFDDKMMAWLKETVDRLQAKGSGNKSFLVLTHHQPLSSFEHPFEKPATQLAQMGFLKGREFVWLYGHEHRMTVYKEQTIVGSLKAYPRCIGHGGMPVEVTSISEPDPKILYYDPRKHPIDKDNPTTFVGYNGHLVLVFDGNQLTIEYRDILRSDLILTETFTPNGTGGLEHTSSKPAGSPLFSGEQPVAK